MRFDWVIIETVTVLVEIFAMIYFLSKRFGAKYDFLWPDVTAFFVIAACCFAETFFRRTPHVLYDLILFIWLFFYLLTLKEGSFLQKIWGLFMASAVHIAVSLAGSGLAASMTDTTYQQTLTIQNMSRLLSLIFTQMMQCTAFYMLANRQHPMLRLKRKPMLILCSMVFTNFMCLLFIWYYVQTPGTDNRQHPTHWALIWVAAWLFIQLAALFAMYELFIHEEETTIRLSASLQRTELEQNFYREMDAMYTDMRNWRHDYNTNLTALQAMIEEKETEKALDFIARITHEPEKVKRSLQTGILALDAVVSSKLWLAQSKGIETNIQAVSPSKDLRIKDHDFCAIVGNLLDNAIEACDRMGKEHGKRFIDFSLFVKGKYIVLTIENSFHGEIKCIGGRYVSSKQGNFHGIGLKHVDSIVKKYDGQVSREIKDGFFETCVMLPVI